MTYPDGAALNCSGNTDGPYDVFREYGGREAVSAVVCKINRLYISKVKCLVDKVREEMKQTNLIHL
jgi:hypothetical protein